MAQASLTELLQEILDRFNSGNPEAKKELINRAYERLVIVARGLLNSFAAARKEEETATVLNQAYLRLHTSLDEVRPQTVRQFFGLAALQVRRVLLDAVRELRGGRAKKNPRPEVRPLDGGKPGEDGGHDPSDPRSGPAAKALDLDVLEAVDRLPDDEREVVDLLFFNGLTQREAAALLKVHEDTVKRRWASARVELAELLSAYGWSE
jgi:RNA polymerase sigma-70 factor (ECF subfamily)